MRCSAWCLSGVVFRAGRRRAGHAGAAVVPRAAAVVLGAPPLAAGGAHQRAAGQQQQRWPLLILVHPARVHNLGVALQFALYGHGHPAMEHSGRPRRHLALSVLAAGGARALSDCRFCAGAAAHRAPPAAARPQRGGDARRAGRRDVRRRPPDISLAQPMLAAAVACNARCIAVFVDEKVFRVAPVARRLRRRMLQECGCPMPLFYAVGAPHLIPQPPIRLYLGAAFAVDDASPSLSEEQRVALMRRTYESELNALLAQHTTGYRVVTESEATSVGGSNGDVEEGGGGGAAAGENRMADDKQTLV
ncbi:hypothetical protein U1Q18_052260 [Sarracenia purpurea var. burkii]